MFDIQLNERGQTCQVINSCLLMSVIYFGNYSSISFGIGNFGRNEEADVR